ncbi:MAG TPA: CorA family divalent cation transporter, partial [Nitrososphaeraceae archaeon]|nr:CorA family divalent cation transporter [Nitrososphaeraceae archaeon]
KDTDYMLSTEKTNKIIAMLTVVFTLSIPITVVSTIYGMNISLPGSDMIQLQFFGEYTILILLIVISTIITLIMFLSFRRLGWLGI